MGRIFRWTMLFVVVVILASGGVAFYTVFFGDKPLSMPLFREMSIIDAVSDAERLGLSVRIEQIESNLPGGRVLAQWPEPGAKIRSDKTLILKISRGGEKRPIPDVRGVDFAKATRLLQEQGFSVGDIIRINDNSRNPGEVIAQNPASPSNAPVSKKVDLLVCAGSADGKLALPDVAQMDESSARQMLSNVGIRISSVEKQNSKNVPEGFVIKTLPAAGASVKSGAAVKLFVSAGEPAAQVREVPVNFPGTGTASRQTQTNNTNTGLDGLSVLDQQAAQQRQRELNRNNTQPEQRTVQPQQPQVQQPVRTDIPVQQPPQPQQPVQAPRGNKIAKIRYQVPPLSKPLPLKIEIVDPNGKRVLFERNARANERIQVDGGYTQEAVVTIQLGGEFVWQEQFR